MLAPLGVIVNESPKQIDPELTASVGAALTVTVDTTPIELTQPNALVPVSYTHLTLPTKRIV